MKRSVQLGDIVSGRLEDLPRLIDNTWQRRTLYAISRCRTAAMGGHIDQCSSAECQKLHLSYNSCRNRHCPRCQGHLREQWINAREEDLLNVSYFHVVFTLPDHLNTLAMGHAKEVYDTLFRVAWKVIKVFGADPKMLGAQTGMISVLHTWGQNMSLHPHLHCIVPAGGVTKSKKWKGSRSKGKFLFPVKAMSVMFRALMVAGLRQYFVLGDELSSKLFAKPWVIYCKRPFFGPKQVIEYLGRYSHKIAISNRRIISLEGGQVLFSAKDYRKGGRKKVLKLSDEEFIRRFALHILPKGFTRIRHFGILSSTTKKKFKIIIDEQIGMLILATPKPKSQHRLCPTCKRGLLVTVAVFDQRGPPKHWLARLSS